MDETVLCNHIHIHVRSVEKNFHVVPFTMLPMVVLILNSNGECGHLNDKFEPYKVVLILKFFSL